MTWTDGIAIRLLWFIATALALVGQVSSAYVPSAGCVGLASTVTRGPDLLDTFVAGSDGAVYTAAWQPGDTAFRGWWKIGNLEVPPCAPISAVSRSANKLDVFATGLDGKVYTAAWQTGDTEFRGWWPVAGGLAQPGAPVGVVSRSTDKLDVFVTGLDERVWTAAWQPSDGGNVFRGWWPVGNLKVPFDAPISAVSRSKDKMDVFATGLDGRVYTAAWQPSDGGNGFRGWWPVAGGQAKPGAPVGVVSRAADKLDVFATGLDGRVWTAAWEPSDGGNGFRGWWPVGTLKVPAGSWISAVSRSTNKMDIFATGTDGSVYTAAWQPGDSAFQGWWSVAGGKSLPGAPVSSVSRAKDKLDVFVVGLDARVWTAAWEPSDGAKGFRGWWPISNLVTGMTDPEVGAWNEVGEAYYSENTAWSEEAQGITTDGASWYIISNGAKVIRHINDDAGLIKQISAQSGWSHIGSGSYYNDWLYVPVEGPYGLWKVSADLSQSKWLPGPMKSFSWAAVNPLNGRMYTCDFTPNPPVLTAYDRDSLARRPEDDISLHGGAPNHVQGGVFTARGRVILVTSDSNEIFVYSARTGYLFGSKGLGNYGSSGSEVESVTVRSWQFHGTPALVHVLELDNDFWNPDDAYVHSYRVPRPELL